MATDYKLVSMNGAASARFLRSENRPTVDFKSCHPPMLSQYGLYERTIVEVGGTQESLEGTEAI